MGSIFLKLFNMGWTSSWLILAVVFLRFILRRAPRWITCLLWAFVAVRLVCPFSVESAFSLIPSSEPLPERIMTEHTLSVDTGIAAVDGPVNGYLGDHYYEGVTVPAGSKNRVMDILGSLWAVGVFALLLYSVVSLVRLRRMTGASVRVSGDIFLCDGIHTPFILGVVKPRIFLPSGMEEGQAEYVVAHERAHLKRKDHWWKPAGFLLLAVYWFLPLSWVAYILFSRDVELACDEKVIKTLGEESKKAYAQALLFCSVGKTPVRRAVTACPLAFGEVGVKERVKNVLHYKKPAFLLLAAAAVCCAAAAVCFLTNPKREEAEPPAAPAAQKEQAQAKEEVWQTASPKEDRGDERQDILADVVARWQRGFVERDGEALAGMMSEELQRERFPEDGDYGFGYSSPWPRDVDTGSFLYEYDEEGAVLYYYAQTSDPHVTCWRETLQFEWENDTCVITGEDLVSYDEISTGAAFVEAYPYLVDGTMMDYTKNGLGETLNENALLSSSMAYRDLFEPESAAAFLLNLSRDPEKVQYAARESAEDGNVRLEITFLEDQQTFTLSMMQPYGDPGIWVPVNYRVDPVARLMEVDRGQLSSLPFEEENPDFSGALCIGEIPEKGIRLYGYNDEEISGRGVALEMGQKIYYYDWYYTSPWGVLPKLYWKESENELQIACTVYTGTGAAAEELHVLRFDDAEGVQESRFDLEGYSALLEERIDWRFDGAARELILSDKTDGRTLGRVLVPKEQGEKVTGIELGMISGFVLGERIIFHVYPGYYMDDQTGIAQYGEMPEGRLAFGVEWRADGEFRLGKV